MQSTRAGESTIPGTLKRHRAVTVGVAAALAGVVNAQPTVLGIVRTRPRLGTDVTHDCVGAT